MNRIPIRIKQELIDEIEIRKKKFEDVNFFEGVIFCKWARLSIEEGGDPILAVSRAIFYKWI